MNVPCSLCGEPVDAFSPRVYRKVVGYERTRKAGGTNALALRQPLEEWAHLHCIEKVKHIGSARQESLL